MTNETTSQFRMVYVTVGNSQEAAKIGRRLVEQRLAACVNIIPGVSSIYRWNGEITEDAETVLIAKTTADRIDALTEAVLAEHSYDCPCVAVLPIEPGNAAFFQWISESVAQSET